MKLVKVDAKDFYLSGTREDLARDATALIDNEPLRRLAYEAIHFILEHQAIVDDVSVTSAIYKVVVGTGMGLLCSMRPCPN